MKPMVVSIEYPKRIVKMILEDGTELDVNARPEQSKPHPDDFMHFIQITLNIPKHLYWEFWKDEHGEVTHP